MINFWNKLPRPFFVLAPMADVTDVAFRSVITKNGKPDVLWTEFVSADGLLSAGSAILMRDLLFLENEHPIVAQLFTSKPANMERASEIVQNLGFDGVDINMGCPDKNVEKQGSGAILSKNPDLAVKLIQSAKKGAPNIPVSVKIRIGYNTNELKTWLPTLLSAEPAVVTIHARTRNEMSKVPARWDTIKQAVKIRDELKSSALIVGNGDATSLFDANKKAMYSNADGVMLGRAIFGNPWLFEQLNTSRKNGTEAENFVLDTPKSVRTRLSAMVEHSYAFEDKFKKEKNFSIMKKHFVAYASDFNGAKELRIELMLADCAKQVKKIVGKFLDTYAI